MAMYIFFSGLLLGKVNNSYVFVRMGNTSAFRPALIEDIIITTINIENRIKQKVFKSETTLYHIPHAALREKCPNADLFLVRIFLYSD